MERIRSKHKKPIRRNKVKRTSNIQVFKLVDPIGQSALFILFVYTLDTASGISYFFPLLVLAIWQLFSWVANLFFSLDEQLKTERKIYFIAATVFATVIALFQRLFLKRLVSLAPTDGFAMGDVAIIGVGLTLAFWYFSICFREIRNMMKGVTDND